MRYFYLSKVLVLWCLTIVVASEEPNNFISKLLLQPSCKRETVNLHRLMMPRAHLDTPCTCGVFLESQMKSPNQIKGGEEPVFSKEVDIPMHPCGLQGNKICSKKCMDMIVSYIPSLGPLVCAGVEREITKEKTYLFSKNCDSSWRNTGFFSAKQFCCADGKEVNCRGELSPLVASSRLNAAYAAPEEKTLPDIFFNIVDQAAGLATSLFNIRNQQY